VEKIFHSLGEIIREFYEKCFHLLGFVDLSKYEKKIIFLGTYDETGNLVRKMLNKFNVLVSQLNTRPLRRRVAAK